MTSGQRSGFDPPPPPAPIPITTWLLVGISLAGIAGDIASRYWGAETDSRLTAGQVSTLTAQVRDLSGAVKDLTDKITNMPSEREVGVLTGRLDRDETAINDVRQAAAVLRADVDNLMRPAFRQPK